jgi:hypothetical protein
MPAFSCEAARATGAPRQHPGDRKQLAKNVGILKVAKSLGIGTGTVQRISKEL